MARFGAAALMLTLMAAPAMAGVLTVPTGGWGIRESGPAQPTTTAPTRESTLSKD